MSISLVVFDWSGTISDDRQPVYTTVTRILQRYEKPTIDFENFLLMIRMTASEGLALLGIPGTSNQLSRLYADQFEQVKREGITPSIYPDVIDTLHYLRQRNLNLALLSSHPTSSLVREAAEYGIDDMFSSMLGDSQDKSQGLIRTCELFVTNPNETLYVGDTTYDVREAKRAKVRSAAVCQGYHPRERLALEEPDLLLERLSDLKNDNLHQIT